MNMATKPEIKSFLIADIVIQEKGTNKWSVIGIFDKIYAGNFPCIHNSLGLFVKLTEADGSYDIRVEFCDSQDRKLAIFEGLKFNVSGRLVMHQFGIQTRQLPLPAPGKYMFNLYFNNDLIQNIPIDVIKIP